MLNTLLGFKNTVINKFGPILGYAIIIIGALAALAILGFLFKSIIRFLIGLAVAGLIVFGVYKIYQLCTAKKNA